MNQPRISTSLLEALSGAIGLDSAARLVALETDPAVEARLDFLGEKANEGTLTPEERSEYEDSVQLIDIISILQAKARMSLLAAAS